MSQKKRISKTNSTSSKGTAEMPSRKVDADEKMTVSESGPTTKKSTKKSKGSKKQKAADSTESPHSAAKKALSPSAHSTSSTLSSDSSTAAGTTKGKTKIIKRTVIRTVYRTKSADDESTAQPTTPKRERLSKVQAKPAAATPKTSELASKAAPKLPPRSKSNDSFPDSSKATAKPQSYKSQDSGKLSESSQSLQPASVATASRSSIKQKLQQQEDELAKKGVTRTSAAATQQQPGAYLVGGHRMERAETGLLTPQKNGSKAPVAANSAIPIQQAKPIVAGSVKPTKGLVVAAELSSDVEAKIEEEVRRRILAQATKAQVVSVTHGAPMLDPKEEARRLADLKELHKPKGVREKLFGDSRNEDIDIESHPEAIRKRSFLNWTVKRNQATNLWVASVQTSQKASENNHTAEMDRCTESFPAATQQEAYETGLANAVPVMQSPDEHPICHVCKSKFAMFRRPQHCKNCGVCVCTNCSTQWPSKMFPATYRAKTTNNVCVACDWLAHSFREALLRANYKRALHLYGTGNVNIRNPFCLDKKAEVLYPVHLAVLGGSLTLLHWLVSERHCPLTVPLKSNKNKVKGGKERAPLLTSKGRSPLVIALMHQKLDLVRYLVADKGIGLFEEKDMNPNLALANFTTLIRMLPPDFFNGKTVRPTQVPHTQAQTRSSGSSSNSPSTKQRRPSL